METFFWVVDLLIPLTMVIIGVVYFKIPPKKINILNGYRTKRSMSSQEAWDYAQKAFALIYLKVGPIYFFIVVISKLITPIEKEYLSLLHSGIGLILLFSPIIFVENELKNRFK